MRFQIGGGEDLGSPHPPRAGRLAVVATRLSRLALAAFGSPLATAQPLEMYMRIPLFSLHAATAL